MDPNHTDQKSVIRIEEQKYDNGAKALRLSCIGQILHGRQYEWYRSGQLKNVRCYHYGKKHGIQYSWESNGGLVSQEIWICDKKITESPASTRQFGTVQKFNILRINEAKSAQPALTDGFHDRQIDSDTPTSLRHEWGKPVPDWLKKKLSRLETAMEIANSDKYFAMLQIRHTFYVVNGKMEGREEKWSAYGTLILQQDLVVVNDRPVPNGVRHEWIGGLSTTYWARGKKIEQKDYIDGMKRCAELSAEASNLPSVLGPIIAGYAEAIRF